MGKHLLSAKFPSSREPWGRGKGALLERQTDFAQLIRAQPCEDERKRRLDDALSNAHPHGAWRGFKVDECDSQSLAAQPTLQTC